MSARSFIDTNVLVYTDDADSPDKRERALELLADLRTKGTGVLSTQVLQEYFVAATRKLGVDAKLARRKTELFSRFDLQVVESEDVLAAAELHIVHDLSFWDALIVTAARRSGCRVLYTEDLAAGSTLAGVEIHNPFA
ncbi:MAG: PIN domain-containing protein [Acidobacteria bacterium]|nr:PIN domain-containing protein [Acidobacteriota bacterium]